MATDFGTDTSCLTGLRSGRLVSGVQLVAEACYRRLTTPRGTLQGGEDEQNYGFDILQAIGSSTTANTAAALPGQIQQELLKDERLESVDVAVTAETVGPATSYTIAINAATSAGPFELVLAISGVTVALLKIDTGS